MLTNGSPFAGLAKVILVIALITAAAAAALSGSDLFNFITNSGKAKAQADRDAIDLRYYGDLKAAETEAAIDKINADSALYADKVKSDIAFNNTLRLVVVGVVALIVTGLATVLLVGLLLRIKSAARPGQQAEDIWRDPQIRSREIQRAREVERQIRSSQAAPRGVIHPADPKDQSRPLYNRPVRDLYQN